jgi:hypothetical protein
MYWTVFCYHSKIAKIINLKGGNLYFGSQFERFQCMIAFGPMVIQNLIVGNVWWSKLLTMWKLGSERNEEEALGSQCLL